MPTPTMAVKEKLADLFSIPKEIMLNLPQIFITGRDELTIENYKNIIEFSEEKIRIFTNSGMLAIEGQNLLLKRITSESVTVSGGIVRLEFL